MVNTNHNAALNITTLVYNWLSFVQRTDANDALISNFILEASYEIEPCLKIKEVSEGVYDENRVGDEQYYSFPQKSVIADIVCVYLLNKIAVENSSVVDAQGVSKLAPTYLSKSSAGSVSVEYSQTDMKKVFGGLSSTFDQFLEGFKKQAFNKAYQLGCLLNICEECYQNVLKMQVNTSTLPFIVSNEDE